MSLTERILRLDRRVIFVVIFIVGVYFSINPIGFPVVTQEWVSDFYSEIGNLQPGDLVLVHWSISATSAEQIAGSVPTMQHLFRIEGIKMIHFSLGIQVDLLDQLIDGANPELHGKTYGEDWIQLGYIAGGETAVAAIGSDIKGNFNTDWYGTPLNNLKLWNEISGNMEDIKLILSISSFDPGADVVRRQLQVPFNTPMIMVGGAGGLTASMQWYNTRQYVGMLLGMTDNSAYEILINEPGIAARSTDVLSMLYVVAIVFIVVGNIAYAMSPQRRGRIG
jgi:hypothetical protein